MVNDLSKCAETKLTWMWEALGFVGHIGGTKIEVNTYKIGIFFKILFYQNKHVVYF